MFKKPFELSDTVEFEPGIGPEWTHDRRRQTTNSIGASRVRLYVLAVAGAKIRMVSGAKL